MLFSEAFGAPQETALSYLGSAGSPYQAGTETFTSEFNTKKQKQQVQAPWVQQASQWAPAAPRWSGTMMTVTNQRAPCK